MKNALVIGANGQDGTFLVRHLLRRGYHVTGIDVQPQSRWDLNVKNYSYKFVDLRHYGRLLRLMKSRKPDFIFHVAAVHTSAGGAYENVFDDVLKVNVGSVHEVLEYLRMHKDGRLIYASSGKVFGFPFPPVIDLNTKIVNQDIYSISKNTAGNLIEYYRKQHGVCGSIVYLFNHESELRPPDFFIPTILRHLSLSLKNKNYMGQVNALDFYCDWGSAKEYADFMIDILINAPEHDFLLATGTSVNAREYVDKLFSLFGLNYNKHITTESIDASMTQKPYNVDLSMLVKHIGRLPQINIIDISKDILDKNFSIKTID